MPTYEYKCRDCGHTFDVVQAMIDESMTVCPECGGELRKVFGAPAIAFKGSGFYANDRRDKSKKASERSGDTAAPKSDKPADGAAAKSEKPAETTGSKDSPKPAPEKKPAKNSESKS